MEDFDLFHAEKGRMLTLKGLLAEKKVQYAATLQCHVLLVYIYL